MGLSVSWIGISGRPKSEVLDQLGMVETADEADIAKVAFGCAELPNGWIIVLADRMDWASPECIADLSKGGLAIGCAIEEHVMFSGVRAYEDGHSLWSVIHDAQGGIYDLRFGGKQPPELGPIRERLVRQQDDEGGADAGVDYIFDIPVELAQAICGYRVDEDPPEGPVVFAALRPANSVSSGGLLPSLARLFGRR